jgi:hypothetical protein
VRRISVDVGNKVRAKFPNRETWQQQPRRVQPRAGLLLALRSVQGFTVLKLSLFAHLRRNPLRSKGGADIPRYYRVPPTAIAPPHGAAARCRGAVPRHRTAVLHRGSVPQHSAAPQYCRTVSRGTILPRTTHRAPAVRGTAPPLQGGGFVSGVVEPPFSKRGFTSRSVVPIRQATFLQTPCRTAAAARHGISENIV